MVRQITNNSRRWCICQQNTDLLLALVFSSSLWCCTAAILHPQNEAIREQVPIMPPSLNLYRRCPRWVAWECQWWDCLQWSGLQWQFHRASITCSLELTYSTVTLCSTCISSWHNSSTAEMKHLMLLCSCAINRNTPIRVQAGTNNSHPVGFLQQE